MYLLSALNREMFAKFRLLLVQHLLIDLLYPIMKTQFSALKMVDITAVTQ